MNQENGQINFTVGLDDTEAQQGAERLGQTFEQTGESAEAAGRRIDEAFEQTGASAESAGTRIDTSFQQVGEAAENAGKRVEDAFHQQAMSARELTETIDTQTKVVADLRDRYEAAKRAADEAFDGSDTAKYNELVEAQEKLKKEYDDEVDALARLNAQREAMDTSGQAEQSLRMQLRMITQELASVVLQYRAMSDAEKASAQGQELERKIEELTAKAGTLRDAMDDVNQAIRGTASDTQNFDAIAQGLNVVTSTAGAAEGALSMLGVSQEELMDIQTKLQASLAISNALSVIQNNLQKQSALMLGVRRAQEYAASVAIAIRTAAEGKGVIATKAATIAQAAFNAVAKANPYVLLATALITVVGALAAFTLGSRKAAEAEKKQAEEAQKLKEKQEEMANAIGNATGNLEAKYRHLQMQWKRLKDDHEKTKWIKDNAGAFKELGLKVKGVSDAEKVLVDMAPQVIAALKAVAEANALMELHSEAYQKRAREWERRTRSAATGDFYTPVSNDEKKYTSQLGLRQEWQDAGLRKGVDYTMDVLGAGNSERYRYELTQAGIDKINKYRNDQAVALNKKLQAQYDEEVQYYEDRWTDAVNRADEARSKIPTNLLAGDGDGGGGGNKPDPRSSADAQERAQERYLQALQRAKEAYLDADLELEQDAELKALNQMALAHRRKLAEIEREKAELLKAKQDAEGSGATLSDDENKVFQDRMDAENLLYQRALEARTKAQVDKEKADMEAYLIEFGTYQQRITAIQQKYETLRNQVKTEGEKLTLAAQEQAEIDAVNQRFGYATQAMADLFADASKKSVREIQKIIDKYETLIEFMQGQKNADTGAGTSAPNITTDQLKGLGFSDEDIKKVQSGEISIKDLTDAIKQLKGELGDRSPWMTFEKNINDAVKKLKEGDLAGGISGIGDAVTQFTPAVKAMGDQLGEAFGFDTGVFDDAMQMLDGLGQGAQAAGQFMSGDFIGGAMSAVSAISSIGGAITNLIDRKHEKRIQELQGQIDKFQEGYKDLERAVSRTYSFVKQKNIDLEIESKKNQIALIKQQIEEERDKKKTDHGKIDEWEKKIRELERDIEDLREAAVDAIFGEDVQAAIENFASSYAEAWTNGEDKAKSAKETVKNMMKQMVTESIKSAIQASGAMERIRRKLQEFYADNVLSPWEQEYVMNMAEALQRDLDRQFGWADSLFSPDKSTSQDSTSRGFETMTQDQAAELNGRFTGIQMETAGISRKFDITNEHHAAIRAQMQSVSEGVSQMVELQGVAVSHLEAIEKNTNELPEMNERLAKIEKNTRNI